MGTHTLTGLHLRADIHTETTILTHTHLYLRDSSSPNCMSLDLPCFVTAANIIQGYTRGEAAVAHGAILVDIMGQLLLSKQLLEMQQSTCHFPHVLGFELATFLYLSVFFMLPCFILKTKCCGGLFFMFIFTPSSILLIFLPLCPHVR